MYCTSTTTFVVLMLILFCLCGDKDICLATVSFTLLWEAESCAALVLLPTLRTADLYSRLQIPLSHISFTKHVLALKPTSFRSVQILRQWVPWYWTLHIKMNEWRIKIKMNELSYSKKDSSSTLLSIISPFTIEIAIESLLIPPFPPK